jgi:predicted CXXCH cytochrome family protein
MRRKIIFLMFACLLAAVPFDSRADKFPSPNAFAIGSGDKSDCLQCHDSFDKLAAGPKNFPTESGEKINPHRYVPHEPKIEKNIPQCLKCHRPHAIPLTSKKEVPEPSIDWCYTCHHAYEFKPCAACHK